jgi:hypothetical protein
MVHSNLTFLIKCSKICSKKAKNSQNLSFFKKALSYLREYEILRNYFGQSSSEHEIVFRNIVGLMSETFSHKNQNNYFRNIL